jgi:4-carboxymuconolactone decarboxylase
MARIPPLKPEELGEHQRRLATEIGASRGGRLATIGPWGLMLRNPELCERAAAFGTMLRDGTSVPKRLSELAIVITARAWTAQFEWNAHAPGALRAGVSPEVVEAIRTRRRPAFALRDEEAVHDYLTELHEKKRVREETYRALVAQIGPEASIELTAIAGFYAAIAMLIVAFEVDVAPGAAPELPE